jgi:hypothetical protein
VQRAPAQRSVTQPSDWALIKFDGLESGIGDRQRIAGHRIADKELVFSVRALPYAEAKFAGVTGQSYAAL